MPERPLSILLQRIVERHERPIVEHLAKWRMFNARHSLDTTDFYGKPIRYSNIHFEGSPREVFWGGLIEPFIKNAIEQAFTDLNALCQEKCLDGKDFAEELRTFLGNMIDRTYREMRKIDGRLLGRAPATSSSVDSKVLAMQEFLNKYAKAAVHRAAPAKGESPVSLKPTYHGMSVDLPALWKSIREGTAGPLEYLAVLVLLGLCAGLIFIFARKFPEWTTSPLDRVEALKRARLQDENVCLNCTFWCSRLKIDTSPVSFDQSDVCHQAGCCDPAIQERIWTKAEADGLRHPIPSLRQKQLKKKAAR